MSTFDDLICIVAVSPTAHLAVIYNTRREAIADLNAASAGQWTFYTADVKIRPDTREMVDLDDDLSSGDDGDHSDCIQPHRTIDGYVDCDGKPL